MDTAAYFGYGAFAAAVAPVFEYHCKLRMGLVGAYTRRRTGNVEHILYVGVGHKLVHGSLCYLAGTLYGGALGQFEFYGKVTLVFLRHKTLWHQGVHHIYEHQSQTEGGVHALGMVESSGYHAAISLVATVEPDVYEAENFGFSCAWLPV